MLHRRPANWTKATTDPEVPYPRSRARARASSVMFCCVRVCGLGFRVEGLSNAKLPPTSRIFVPRTLLAQRDTAAMRTHSGTSTCNTQLWSWIGSNGMEASKAWSLARWVKQQKHSVLGLPPFVMLPFPRLRASLQETENGMSKGRQARSRHELCFGLCFDTTCYPCVSGFT